MLITYNDVLSSKKSMEKLCDMPLPASQALALSRMVKKINEEIQIFEQTRYKLCTTYGTRQEDGSFVFGEENKQVFLKEFQELLLSGFEVGDKLKIKLPPKMHLDAKMICELEYLVDFELQEE